MFLPSFELGTFRVLGERDNHYTTETADSRRHTNSRLAASVSHGRARGIIMGVTQFQHIDVTDHVFSGILLGVLITSSVLPHC